MSGGALGLANLIVAWLLAAVWVVHMLEAARGMPKIVDITSPAFDVSPGQIFSCQTERHSPKVTIVVPARNEALTIEPALRSLLEAGLSQLRTDRRE